VTNDAWFDYTPAPYQHFDMAILRAVETGKFIVRAANTGISGIINCTGNVITTSPLFERATLTGTIFSNVHRASTLYVKYGDIFCYLCILISSIMIVIVGKYVSQSETGGRRHRILLRCWRKVWAPQGKMLANGQGG
jgi:apolipoprotein N-acyltransferase